MLFDFDLVVDLFVYFFDVVVFFVDVLLVMKIWEERERGNGVIELFMCIFCCILFLYMLLWYCGMFEIGICISCFSDFCSVFCCGFFCS